MAFGNCCHSKTIAVSGAETHDSGTNPAVALHDNRTVISVLETDNPLLSGLYYHVGCSQYYMTMELTHQSHSPMMERCCKLMHQAHASRCCKLMHQMVYCVCKLTVYIAILASCIHGTSPSHGMTKHTSIQLDITCGCHE